MVWIEKGILKNLSYTRFWAQKQGEQPTGPPLAGGLALAGGTKSTEELIAGCERGILVTHFFYIRSLDAAHRAADRADARRRVPRSRTARSRAPLKNFRWNESPLLMLNRLEDIGRPVPTSAGRMMPALRIREFNFSSSSDAV